MLHRSIALMSTCLTLLWVSPALAQEPDLGRSALNGSWLIVERGDHVESMLVVDDVSIVTANPAIPMEAGMSLQYVPELSSPGHHLLMVQTSEQKGHVHWLLQGPDRGVLLLEGDDDLVVTRRIGPMPESLIGNWTVGHPEGDVPRTTSVTIDDRTITLASIDGVQQMRALPLVTDGTFFEVVGVTPPNDERWWIFQPIPEGGFIVWESGANDYTVFFTAGQQPAWVLSTHP